MKKVIKLSANMIALNQERKECVEKLEGIKEILGELNAQIKRIKADLDVPIITVDGKKGYFVEVGK